MFGSIRVHISQSDWDQVTELVSPSLHMCMYAGLRQQPIVLQWPLSVICQYLDVAS